MNKRNITKFNKSFIKNSTNLLNHINMYDYIENFGKYQTLTVKVNNKDLIVTSSVFANISTRRTLVNTLKNINYQRGNQKWVEQAVIAFLEEVMSLYLYEGDDDYIKTVEKDISKRYNVAINRFKTQVALFLNNLDKGKDNFHILSYFSPYEIITWKYRDINKLQEAIENDKISEKDKNFLRDLNIIE